MISQQNQVRLICDRFYCEINCESIIDFTRFFAVTAVVLVDIVSMQEITLNEDIIFSHTNQWKRRNVKKKIGGGGGGGGGGELENVPRLI